MPEVFFSNSPPEVVTESKTPDFSDTDNTAVSKISRLCGVSLVMAVIILAALTAIATGLGVGLGVGLERKEKTALQIQYLLMFIINFATLPTLLYLSTYSSHLPVGHAAFRYVLRIRCASNSLRVKFALLSPLPSMYQGIFC